LLGCHIPDGCSLCFTDAHLAAASGQPREHRQVTNNSTAGQNFKFRKVMEQEYQQGGGDAYWDGTEWSPPESDALQRGGHVSPCNTPKHVFKILTNSSLVATLTAGAIVQQSLELRSMSHSKRCWKVTRWRARVLATCNRVSSGNLILWPSLKLLCRRHVSAAYRRLTALLPRDLLGHENWESSLDLPTPTSTHLHLYQGNLVTYPVVTT
jgi:hypothetical protein